MVLNQNSASINCELLICNKHVKITMKHWSNDRMCHLKTKQMFSFILWPLSTGISLKLSVMYMFLESWYRILSFPSPCSKEYAYKMHRISIRQNLIMLITWILLVWKPNFLCADTLQSDNNRHWHDRYGEELSCFFQVLLKGFLIRASDRMLSILCLYHPIWQKAV